MAPTLHFNFNLLPRCRLDDFGINLIGDELHLVSTMIELLTLSGEFFAAIFDETAKSATVRQKALMQLRLAAARATVRYALNTSDAQLDILDGAELSELCDEYALRVLAIWLATTCGSHICRSAMSKTHWRENSALLSHMVRTNEYPFANPISQQLETELIGSVRDQLLAGLAHTLSCWELSLNKSTIKAWIYLWKTAEKSNLIFKRRKEGALSVNSIRHHR